MNQKPSILIVDDEPINLQLYAECLAKDYVIFFALNGKDALDRVHSTSIDLILLDINMPEMDGFETLQQMHKRNPAFETPVIYLTADGSEETIAKAFEYGAADYVTKPFKHKELLARVKNRIEIERLRSEQRELIRQNIHLMDIINRHIAYIKTDTDGIITEISPNFCEMIQSDMDSYDSCIKRFVGKNVNIFKSGYTHKEVYRTLWNTIERGETYIHDIENRNFQDGTNWYRVTISPDTDENGTIEGYVAFYHNIDDQIRLEHDASTDFLTGVNNRFKFEKLLIEEIARSKRYNLPLTMLMADIDHFKQVNDIYGHAIGDIILKEVCDVIAQNIRQSDILARWGGEEFVILCPHTDLLGGEILAETLRLKIDEYTFTKVGHTTASFGVAPFDLHIDQATLFSNVDTALYEAKEGGRNKVVVFHEAK